MSNSYFLARLMGPVGLVIGLGLLVNGAHYRRMAEEMLQSPAFIFISGLLAMPAGLAIVLTHNVWVASWPLIITLIGWAGLIGGVLRIVFPQAAEAAGTVIFARRATLPVAGAVVSVLSAWLIYAGYFA